MDDKYKKLMKECLKDAMELIDEEDMVTEASITLAIELFKIRLASEVFEETE